MSNKDFVFKPEVGFTFKTRDGRKGQVVYVHTVEADDDYPVLAVYSKDQPGFPVISYWLTLKGEYFTGEAEGEDAIDYWTEG